ncbi:hypothetical protein WDU94_011272 [Cyamophila willieti]
MGVVEHILGVEVVERTLGVGVERILVVVVERRLEEVGEGRRLEEVEGEHKLEEVGVEHMWGQLDMDRRLLEDKSVRLGLRRLVEVVVVVECTLEVEAVEHKLGVEEVHILVQVEVEAVGGKLEVAAVLAGTLDF